MSRIRLLRIAAVLVTVLSVVLVTRLKLSTDLTELFPKTADCYSCHQKNGATDTTFVQFYPTLIETAKKNRNFKETE